MKLEYDKEADAVCMYLKYSTQDDEVKKTVEIKENIILGYDKKRKLLGLDILNVKKVLAQKVSS